MSKGFEGMHHSKKTREKMRKAALGDKNHNFGKHLSEDTKIKLGLSKSGDKNGKWKGVTAKYHAKHNWIINNFGNPPKCEDCNKIGEKVNGRWSIDWSNIDHKYRRVREDYKGRCRKCHNSFDLKFKKVDRLRDNKGRFIKFN